MTFAIGFVGAFALSQINQSRQNDAIAILAAQLAEMQVTRAETIELMAVTPPAAATPVALETAPSTSIPSASAVLAARAPTAVADERTQEEKITDAIAAANRNKMRMLTEGVVAGLYSVTAESNDGTGSRIAVNSVNASSTAQELDTLLAQAAEQGDLQAPGAVAPSSAAVDSQTLLFDLVQRSLEDGNEKENAAAAELHRRAFEASTAKTQIVNCQRFYTVEAGDSLAYISLQFYGSTNAYEKLFDANRSAISSPNQIQIGQQLVIPEV